MTRLLTIARRSGIADVPPQPLVSDSFDRANSTNLGNPEVGPGPWQELSGDWEINDNTLKVTSATPTPNQMICVTESGHADAIITYDMVVPGSDYDGGVAFRVQDDNNYLLFNHNTGGAEREIALYKRDAGAFTLVGKNSSAGLSEVAGTIHAFEVRVTGATIEILVDGDTKLTATLGQAEADKYGNNTKHGLRVYENTGIRYDNFKVVDPASALVSDSFDRADSTSTLGTADTGQMWTALDGVWGITAKQAYSSAKSAVDRPWRVAVVDAGTADVKVRVGTPNVNTANNRHGLSFRCVDMDNRWWFGCDTFAGAFVVAKLVNGVYTEVGTAAVGTQSGQTLTIETSGSTIVCKRNGVTLMTLTDTDHATATRHGLADYFDNAGDSNNRYDGFRVEAA